MNKPQALAINGVSISTHVRGQSWQANLQHSVSPILREKEKGREIPATAFY